MATLQPASSSAAVSIVDDRAWPRLPRRRKMVSFFAASQPITGQARTSDLETKAAGRNALIAKMPPGDAGWQPACNRRLPRRGARGASRAPPAALRPALAQGLAVSRPVPARIDRRDRQHPLQCCRASRVQRVAQQPTGAPARRGRAVAAPDGRLEQRGAGTGMHGAILPRGRGGGGVQSCVPRVPGVAPIHAPIASGWPGPTKSVPCRRPQTQAPRAR